MIDLLHTVDWIVDRPLEAAQQLSSALAIPPPPEHWVHTLLEHQYEAVFVKTADDLVQAPTRLEFIRALPAGEVPQGCTAAPVEVVRSRQRPRPQLTHATVVCVADFDGFTEQVRGRGTPVWVEEPCPHLPHRRGWVGWTTAGGTPSPPEDHGLFLEYIPTTVLGRRVPGSVGEPVSVAPRVSRRVQLVADLDAAVGYLERRIGLVPSAPLAPDRELRATVARYGFTHRASAELVLAEPLATGRAADYMAAWGPGPWLTTMAVEQPEEVAAGAPAVGCTVAAGSHAPVVEIPPGLLIELEPL